MPRGRHVSHARARALAGTRELHEALGDPRGEYALKCTRALPTWPQARLELFVFVRNVDGRNNNSREEHSNSGPRRGGADALLTCDVCGAAAGACTMRRCPWSRWMRVCGDGCALAGGRRHVALLRLAYCGARLTRPPRWAEWEGCGWLGPGGRGADERRWEALREATPKSEPRPHGG